LEYRKRGHALPAQLEVEEKEKSNKPQAASRKPQAASRKRLKKDTMI